jgi:hypothetical protein
LLHIIVKERNTILKALQRYFVFKTNTTISNTTIYHPVFNKSNTTGISSGAEATAYPIGIPELTPDWKAK